MNNEIVRGEFSLIKLMYEHYTIKEISEKLDLSISGVEKKIRQIKSFHKVDSKRELLAKYYSFKEKPKARRVIFG